MRSFLLSFVGLSIGLSAVCGYAQTANVVFVHGKVWTGVPAQEWVEAVAVSGDKIVAAGSSEAMLKLAASDTKVVELHGRLMLPGFNDAHVHVPWGGEQIVSVHLTDAASQAEFRRRIAEFAKTAPKGRWIENGSWDHERWTPVALPAHQLIDDVTPDNPVAVTRTDGQCVGDETGWS
jgi:predicted amidohydrolase YtcJ